MTDKTKEEIDLKQLQETVGTLADAVKNLEEPNYDKIKQDIDEIIDAKIKGITEPKKDKDIKDEILVDKANQKIKNGKFAGMKVADLQIADQVCKAFNVRRSDDLQKAMTSTGTNTGDEWVPTEMEAELWENFKEKTKVADKISQFDMPTNPYDFPIKTDDVTVYYNSTENSETTSSDVPTDKNTFTAGKLMAEVDFSYELTEDSILAVVGIIKQSMRDAMAKAMDYVVLHGDDTTGSSNITYYGSAITGNHRALVFDGLRHAGLIDNSSMASALGTLGTSDILTLAALAGKYFDDPGDNVIFTDIYTYLKLIALDDFRTVDKYGANATIIRGELGKWYGVPVVPSNQYGKTDSSGYVNATSASNTKGSLILVHTPSWKIGWRRRIMLESDKNIKKQQNELVISVRMALKGWGTMSSQTHTAYGYNITV